MAVSPDRRRLLRSVVLGGAATLGGCARLLQPQEVSETTDERTPTGTATDVPDETPSVALDPVAEGLGTPTTLAVTEAGDRTYVGTRRGVVHVLGPDGLRDEPLFDLRDAVMIGGERGLLGIALHPEFADTRRLFVRYSSSPRPGTPDGYSHTFVLSEFRVSVDGLRAGRNSERPILELPEPHEVHNAGDLAFGPEGYLYVPTGAGGGVGFGHATDWYDGNLVGNGQDTTENLLGGVLRLDVDGDPTEPVRSEGAPQPDGDAGYAIPTDNPLVGRESHRGEYYAWGFRNPWRLSFDGEDCFVADVGAAKWESVHAVEAGGNYGWSVTEGTYCYDAEDCPDETPPSVRGGEPLLDPVIQYPNDRHLDRPVNGSAAVVGNRYRGSALPDLTGTFLFADWRARGRLFAATPVGGELWPTEVVAVEEGQSRLHLVFDVERAGPDEWYVLGFSADGNGAVSRLVPPGEGV
ncbi:sugar dehydrogenase [Halobacteriales archaeon QS_1_68_20]|nr:MAG: sugar dehydrogenase [Halobacteriales archaeon QS_1_68_20]